MRVGVTISVCIASTVLATLVCGCASRGYVLDVSLDPSYQASLDDGRVFVHLVPVNPTNRGQWAAVDGADYWHYGASTAPRTPAREKGTAMFELSAERPRSSLSASDPVWGAWQAAGTTELMVMSSMPPEKRASGDSVSPRLFIPAAASRWSADGVRIVITAGGIQMTPAPQGP